MASEKQIVEVIEKIAADMNGFIAASLVDMESGLTLGAKSNRSEFDLNVASAYNSELVKQKLKIMKALNLKSTLEDILLTLSDQIHIIKIVSPSVFLYLAADRENTNLAIVRSAILKHVAALR
jgi:predicted regulator of Ras-like GTPase activity (Roadblock/LC7/MglB family)